MPLHEGSIGRDQINGNADDIGNWPSTYYKDQRRNRILLQFGLITFFLFVLFYVIRRKPPLFVLTHAAVLVSIYVLRWKTGFAYVDMFLFFAYPCICTLAALVCAALYLGTCQATFSDALS